MNKAITGALFSLAAMLAVFGIFEFVRVFTVALASAAPEPMPLERAPYIVKRDPVPGHLHRNNDLLAEIFGHPVGDRPVFSMTLTATGYSARKEECDSTPEVTASMTPSRVGVIAISRDLEANVGLKMGQMVVIKGMGLFRVEDRMNKRWEGRIDILHGNPEAARLFGKREVEILWIGGDAKEKGAAS